LNPSQSSKALNLKLKLIQKGELITLVKPFVQYFNYIIKLIEQSQKCVTMSNEAPEVEPHSKRRKKEASPSSSSGFLQSLPEAVAMICLARVSRLDHAALSLVSKSCRSMVLSPELYQTRSLIGYAEKFLYVCFCMPTDETLCWCILLPTVDVSTGNNVNRAHLIPSLPSQPRKDKWQSLVERLVLGLSVS